MAILKTALEESLLSKSEQAALRVLARVQQLNEGRIILGKYSESRTEAIAADLSFSKKISEYDQYLNTAIKNAILQHRLPANSPDETKS